MQVDARLLWRAVLADLQQIVPPSAYEWMRHTRLAGFAADVATVEVADRVTAETLNRRFAPEIERTLSARVGRPITASFQPGKDVERMIAETPAVAASSGEARRNQPVLGEKQALRPVSTLQQSSAQEQPRQMALAQARGHGLNPRYVFRTYVVGSANRFTHAASVSVAEHPGGKFNPLFIHGGVGLGKTHLLHAIGHRALELFQDLHVAYVTSEKFTNDLIAAIRQQRTDDFRARYREIDVLMIDDIQFIAGKESTQEEFFHTFNSLYQSGKQVIISSDKPPKAISALEERLRSRFEGGLIADVQLPDFEMRIAILRIKGEELNFHLPADVAEYIAHKDQKNIRELEGALNKVIARSQITGEPMSLPLAIEALADIAPGDRRLAVTRDNVIDAVLTHFSVGRRELAGRSRIKEIVLPRQVAMYLLRAETDASLLEIGGVLGGRDHTTVLHGIRQIERTLETDVGLRSRILAIRESMVASEVR
ncbi:MAG: chromosomal replication initiator protein DnaA [Chloroflexia bacterium]|nr:chromosomal replication initiator protein DnaA [Chloroflexia bacterium]